LIICPSLFMLFWSGNCKFWIKIVIKCDVNKAFSNKVNYTLIKFECDDVVRVFRPIMRI